MKIATMIIINKIGFQTKRNSSSLKSHSSRVQMVLKMAVNRNCSSSITGDDMLAGEG